MVRLLLCYMMIAPIVARPLAVHMEKRHSSSRQMEDVQLSVAGTFPVDRIATHSL